MDVRFPDSRTHRQHDTLHQLHQESVGSEYDTHHAPPQRESLRASSRGNPEHHRPYSSAGRPTGRPTYGDRAPYASYDGEGEYVLPSDSKRRARHNPRMRALPPEPSSQPSSVFDRIVSVTGESLAVGVIALSIASAGFALVKLASKVRETFNADAPSLFQTYCQAFKGNMVATGVTMTTSFVALPLARYVDKKVDNNWAGTAVGILPFFLATTFATPKLSSLVSTHKVTQIGGACYGLLGAGSFAILKSHNIIDTRINQRSAYKESLSEKIEHCALIGILSVLAGGIGLGITTTASSIPGIWNTLPAGVITGGMIFPTTLMSRPVTKALVGAKASEETRTTVRVAASIIPVFFATAFLTRVVSAQFLKNRVSYFDALGFGAIATLTAGMANKHFYNTIDARFEEEYDEHFEEEWSPRRDQLKPASPKMDYFEMGKLSVIAGAVTALASIAFLGIKQLSETYPILKGTIPTAAVGSVTTGMTFYLVNKFGDKISKDEDTQALIAIACAFFATTALTPKVSQYISKYRVGYVKAAGLSAAAGIGGLGALILKEILQEKLLGTDHHSDGVYAQRDGWRDREGEMI